MKIIILILGIFMFTLCALCIEEKAKHKVITTVCKKKENYMNKTTPTNLATPTDINSESVAKIADALNPLIADAFALYVKTKNFHWHVYGPHFRDYHKLFDEQAESVFGSIDTLAERVRKIGKTTIRSIGDIQSLTQIDDCEDFPTPEDMIAELLEDNQLIQESMRSAMDICEENGDKPTANILQSLLDDTEKRIWFLFELTQ